MNMFRPFSRIVLLAAVSGSLAACGSMSDRDRSTATGAVIGGAAGAVLGGSAVSTVGGAAVGAVVGNQVEKRKEK